MKTFTVLVLIVAFAAVGIHRGSAQSSRSLSRSLGEGDVHTLLAVKSDGSCLLTSEAVAPRKTLEMQVRLWERYRKMEGGDDSEGTDSVSPAAPPSQLDQKPLTDAELAAKVREMYQQQGEQDEESPFKLDKVEVLTNSVRIVASRAFGTLKELLALGVYSWGPTPLMFENARLEIDTNRLFRITFTPSKQAAQYARMSSREWKTEKLKFEWKLVAPGKILSSGLPQTQENATWLNLDGDKPDSVEAALKLVGTPLVITAEPAGLKLDEPLDANKVAMASRRRQPAAEDLPVTDAGPGFVAEPVSLTVSTLYLFPDGEKQAKDGPMGYLPGGEAPGVTVSAKVFPPKGRVLRSVSGLRVKSAKDDKGRAIAGSTSDEGEIDQENYRDFYSTGSGSEQEGPARVELRLGLPAPDAQAIDEIQAEAVALTIGGWKEMTLTNVLADTNAVIDLGELLPSAKMVISKVTSGKPSTSVEARLEGPLAINQIEIKIKLDSRREGSSSMATRRTTTSGNKTVRSITVQSYDYNSVGRGEAGKAPVALLIRYPQDAKRERIRFKLTGLDLL